MSFFSFKEADPTNEEASSSTRANRDLHRAPKDQGCVEFLLNEGSLKAPDYVPVLRTRPGLTTE